jgi:hypothetical protein
VVRGRQPSGTAERLIDLAEESKRDDEESGAEERPGDHDSSLAIVHSDAAGACLAE